MVLTSFYQASKKFKSLSKIQIISKFFGVVLIIILSYYFNLVGYSIGYSLSFVLSLVFLAKPFFKSFVFNKQKSSIDIHWKLAKFSLLANLVGQLNFVIDILFLNQIRVNQEMFGQYAFALNFIVMLTVIPTTIQQISIPYFSEKSNKLDEWKRVFKKYNRVLFAISTITVILAAITVPVFIHFVFSGKYDASIGFFWVLLIGWFFRSLYFLKGAGLVGLGKIKQNFYSGVIVLPFNLIILFLLIQRYEIWGAAIANAIGGILTFIVVSIVFSKSTKF